MYEFIPPPRLQVSVLLGHLQAINIHTNNKLTFFANLVTVKYATKEHYNVTEVAKRD
jgi:hypothetical protein